MNKTIVLVVSLLSLGADAMRPQHQQQKQQDEQQQQTQQKEKKKQRWYSNDKDNSSDQPKEEDAVVSDLLTQMSAIVKAIEKQEGSIDNHINSTQKKKRVILCGICFKPECPYSTEVYD